jgi:hypothetical protein
VIVEDDDSVVSGSNESCSGTFSVNIVENNCIDGSYSDLTLEVEENGSAQISGFDSSCTEVEFSMTADGGSLPSFMTQSTSTLNVNPVSNDEAGTY